MFNKIHFFEDPFALPYMFQDELEKEAYLRGKFVIISNRDQAIEFNKVICGKNYLPDRVGIYLRMTKTNSWVDVSELFGIISHYVNIFTNEVGKED